MLKIPLIVLPELMTTMKGKIWNASNQCSREIIGWHQKISLEQSLGDTIRTIKMLRKNE